MERLLKELIQIEKKRNSLLTDIANSLTDIASKEKSEITETVLEEIKQNQNKVGKSALV